MRRAQRSKSMALVFLLTAVVVGGGLGFTAERIVTHERGAGMSREARRASLYDELGLAPQQRPQMDSILDEQQRRIEEVFRPIRPRLDSIKTDARNQIRTALTPEQFARLETIEARMREKRGARKDKNR